MVFEERSFQWYELPSTTVNDFNIFWTVVDEVLPEQAIKTQLALSYF